MKKLTLLERMVLLILIALLTISVSAMLRGQPTP